jgi:hypothetical protein
MAKKTPRQIMVAKLEQARRLLIDARVAGAMSDNREDYHLSLLVESAEDHVSTLHAHISGKLGRENNA